MNSKHLDMWLIPVLIHMLSFSKHNLNAFLWLLSLYLNAYGAYSRNHNHICHYLLLIPFAVENGRQKTPRSLCIQTQTSPDVLSSEKTLELAQYKTKSENQSRFILHLKQLVSCGNAKFEALTVVIQHLLSEVRICAPAPLPGSLFPWSGGPGWRGVGWEWGEKGSSVHGLFCEYLYIDDW